MPSLQDDSLIAPREGAPALGTVVADKYELQSILGVGGMGVVYGATHLQLGQSVAIKVLIADELQRKEALTRFLREARAAAALQSDHVVRIFDVGTLPDGVPYMVMERLRGKDLGAVLAQRGALAWGEAAEYIAQACHALGLAHLAGIIHRDLKPSNLFLSRRSDGSPLVKVLDFGISKTLGSLGESTQARNLTGRRVLLGSPSYMAPEQIRDASGVDHRCDLWSLGVTLYELIAGQPAFHGDTLPGLCAAVAADSPEPLHHRVPEVPLALSELVARCLAKSPEERPATADELADGLSPFRRVPSTLPLSAEDLASSDSRPGHRPIPEPGAPTRVLTPPSAPSARRPRGDAAPSETLESTLDRAEWQAPTGAGDTHIEGRPVSQLRWLLTAGAVVALLGLLGGVTLWRRGPLAAGHAPQPSFATAQDPGQASAGFELSVSTEPEGATLVEGEREWGTTPLTLTLTSASFPEKSRHFVLRRAGYAPLSFEQERSAASTQRHFVLQREEPDELPRASAPRAAGAVTSRPLPATEGSAGSPEPAPAPTALGLRTLR